MQVKVELYFTVNSKEAAEKLERILRDYANNDIIDVDGEDVEFRGSDLSEM